MIFSLASLIGEYIAKRRRRKEDSRKAHDRFDPYFDYEKDKYHYDDREK